MKRKFSLLIGLSIAAQICLAPFASAGDVVVNSVNPKTIEETQKLIDARPDIQRQMENLDRGVVAVKVGDTALVSWRWLGTESADVSYNVYRNGEKLTPVPINATNYTDITASDGASYQVSAVVGGAEGEKSKPAELWASNYKDIPIQKPDGGTVNGESYTYNPNDASAADLDGDGEYEIILKWDPSNSKDAATVGFTGPAILDAYKMNGTRLWRINMGPNIRAGAHDTQFMAYDFDGDGKAELAVRTADGTVDGTGKVIGDEKANWALSSNGKNLLGPLYLSVFNGETGAVIDTVDYDPQTTDLGVGVFGDGYGNRSERYLAAVAYVDGKSPSMVFCRGYYGGKDTGPGRTVIAAYNLVGGKLQKVWRFDTTDSGNEKYIGQGNHSLSVADVDYDGCDEIIYGSLAIDNDGKPLYSTGLGHGDAQHVGDFIPSRPGLEVFSVHEDSSVAYGEEMRDARTGEILFGADEDGDVGRGAADDVDPTYPGAESWASGKMMSSTGEVIYTNPSIPVNFFAWWDGDLGRETQDSTYISKWNPEKKKAETIFRAEGVVSNNGTKANPSLTADLLGDFREETIYPLKDGTALRLFTTNIATNYKIPTLMHDIQYRLHVALQNVAYNQPTHTSYYLGFDTTSIPVPQIFVKQNGTEVKNPDLSKKSWSIDSLYKGTSVVLALDQPKAISDNTLVRIDNENENVAPYLADGGRTLVPLRFIAEAFGADVAWDDATKGITITSGKTEIKMTVDKADYTLNGNAKALDVPATVKEGRTFVPLRAIVEDLGKKVFWDPQGLIVISDKDISMTSEEAQAMVLNLKNAKTPAKVEQLAIIPVSKLFENQLPVFAVEASDNDGNNESGAIDGDMETRWSAYGPNWLIVDLGSEQEIAGVAIAMWKGDERIYPFSIEVSNDKQNWTTALEKTTNSGKTTDAEQYMFKAPVKGRYVRYSGDGATTEGKNYCHISEIVVLKK
ncbi:MAG: stalk domain-containing protein [Clostridia bacterium]|nr:stalk domain-containing protein [Clostridia bacterium]